jgi:phosphate transport system substrate-binding protein
VNKASLDKPQVAALMKFLLGQSKEAIESTGYIVLPDGAYAAAQARVDEKKTGTVFHGAQPGMKIEDILKGDAKP